VLTSQDHQDSVFANPDDWYLASADTDLA